MSEAETAGSLAKISVLETETGDCFKVESLTKNLQYIIANGKYLAQSSIVLKDSHARIITIVVGDYKADTFLSSKIDISIERKLYWGLVLFRNLVNILVIASLILTCGFVVAFYVFKSQTQNFIQRENFDAAYDRLSTLQGMPYKYLFLVDKDLKNNLDSLVLNKIKPNSNYKLPLKFTNDFPIFINIHTKIDGFVNEINHIYDVESGKNTVELLQKFSENLKKTGKMTHPFVQEIEKISQYLARIAIYKTKNHLKQSERIKEESPSNELQDIRVEMKADLPISYHDIINKINI